mgnify:CR=1 FL=1
MTLWLHYSLLKMTCQVFLIKKLKINDFCFIISQRRRVMNTKIIELKKLLRERKITYKELSERTNIPEGTLKNIFSGFTKNPRIDTIQTIENALATDTKTSDFEIVNTYTSNEEEEILDMYRKLSKENKSVILKNFYILLNPDERSDYQILKNIK